MATRMESDSLGEVPVDQERYWGAQTERARNNFTISPYRIPGDLLTALARIKGAAAEVNRDLGLLESTLASAIAQAAGEIASGLFSQEFPLDVFQTGSGTSWNMNANEVVAGRANELLTGRRGGKTPVHPNDHVNRGQSSNDVIPTALNLADLSAARRTIRALEGLASAFSAKAEEFGNVIKIGRTHLQDAVPMTLGAEFSAFARQMTLSAARLRDVFPRLCELALGGTALGTGLNAHPEFAVRMAKRLSEITGEDLRRAENFYEAISARDVQVELMGAVNACACALMKICNDLRLLSSGPRTGFAEILLPELQPGSSIMPGKVNPVILEMAIQACAHIMGKVFSVTIAGQNAPLQLNIMQPLLAFETLSALDLLTETALSLREKCVLGIQADRRQCETQVERSLAMVTPLASLIGYDKAAELAKQAMAEGLTIRELARRTGVLPENKLAEVLDPKGMV